MKERLEIKRELIALKRFSQIVLNCDGFGRVCHHAWGVRA